MCNNRSAFFALFAGIMVLLCVTACSQTSSSQPDSVSSANAEETSPSIPQGKGQIHQIGSEGEAEQQTSSENGYYELVPVFPDSYNILYTDYATNRQLYLCSSPGCNHAGESCTSYVDTSKGNVPGLLFSDDKLYLVSPATVSDDFLPRVEVMNADGSNRRLLAEFKASQNLNTGWFLADADSFYFVMENVASDGSYSKSLCSLNKQDGSLKTIKDLDYDQWLLDGNGSHIYLKTIEEGQPPERDLFDTEEAFQDAVEDINLHKISVLDVNAPGQEVEVDTWKQSERSGGMLDGKMYYYDFFGDSFVMKDYDAGETVAVPNSTGLTFHTIYPRFVLDGKLIFVASTDGAGKEHHVSSFYVDFAENRVSEIGVMDRNRNRPVSICAVYNDQLYAVYDTLEKNISFDQNGQIQMTTISLGLLGHTPVQDFLEGNCSFTPCETVE